MIRYDSFIEQAEHMVFSVGAKPRYTRVIHLDYMTITYHSILWG
jgi:hypothetical protein